MIQLYAQAFYECIQEYYFLSFVYNRILFGYKVADYDWVYSIIILMMLYFKFIFTDFVD